MILEEGGGIHETRARLSWMIAGVLCFLLGAIAVYAFLQVDDTIFRWIVKLMLSGGKLA